MTTETKRSEAGHTPGPWRIQPDGRGICFSGSAGFDLHPWGARWSMSEADLSLIASAPTMRATLDATADSLAKIEIALGITIDHIEDEEPRAAMESLMHIRMAVSALLANVKEG